MRAESGVRGGHRFATPRAQATAVRSGGGQGMAGGERTRSGKGARLWTLRTCETFAVNKSAARAYSNTWRTRRRPFLGVGAPNCTKGAAVYMRIAILQAWWWCANCNL